MFKVENRSKEEITKIGEAFAAEKAGIVTLLTEEQTVKSFEIMANYFYRAGVLYSASETGEGCFKEGSWTGTTIRAFGTGGQNDMTGQYQ